MKFIEKERTLNERETLSLLFWFAISILGTITITFFIYDLRYLTIPVIVIIAILLRMEWENNKYMGILMGKRKK